MNTESLRGLVEKWRGESAGWFAHQTTSHAIGRCADELESLLNQAPASPLDAITTAMHEYLPPDGISAKEFASQVIAALDGTPVVNQGLTARAQLSDIERRCLESVRYNSEYEAGDVHDTAPSMKDDEDAYWAYHTYWAIDKLLAAAPAAPVAGPIPMILLCPRCGKQHIDAPETRDVPSGDGFAEVANWTNPPHRSHLCHECGCIWRPADVPTVGVVRIETRGKADTWDVATAPAVEVDEAMVELASQAMARVRVPLIDEDGDEISVLDALAQVFGDDDVGRAKEIAWAMATDALAAALGLEVGGNG